MTPLRNTTMSKSEIITQLKAHASKNGDNAMTINEMIARLENAGEWDDDIDVQIISALVYGDSPQMLTHLEERIFGGLPNDVAKEWPTRFMLAIKPGSDLSLVGWKFLHWLLTDKSINPGIEHVLVRDTVRRCADIIASMAEGDMVDIAEATEAAAAARVAAGEAAARVAEAARAAAAVAWATRAAAGVAWAAAGVAAVAWTAARAAAASSSAAWAVEAAAEEAVAGVAVAAWATAWETAAVEAAKEAAWQKMADKLIELIEAAPIPETNTAA